MVKKLESVEASNAATPFSFAPLMNTPVNVEVKVSLLPLEPAPKKPLTWLAE